MVILLSFEIDSPPGPIQLIITELNSTPLTALTIHWISCGLPTIAPCMGPDGDVAIVGAGTANHKRLSVDTLINNTLFTSWCMYGYIKVHPGAWVYQRNHNDVKLSS